VSYDKKGWNHFLGIVFQKGQLGLGDFSTRSSPTVVTALSKYKVVKAAAGRAHTVVVTSKGESLAFGFNKHGQLGAGFVKEGELQSVGFLFAEA
jgi:alpha-tubulin suppressor-like RCC1 family protein